MCDTCCLPTMSEHPTMSEYDPELGEEQVQRLKKSPVVKMALACDEAADALGFILANDEMRDEFVGSVLSKSSRIESRETAEEIVTITLDEMARYAGMVRPVEPGEPEDGG